MQLGGGGNVWTTWMQGIREPVTGKLFQKQSSVGRWQPEEVIENAELNPGLLRSWGPYPL